MTVKPTKQGLREIDESHDVYSMKYVTGKPCNSLEGDQWLKLIEAEKSKLLTIGKKLALKKYDHFTLNTFCFCAISRNFCYKNNELIHIIDAKFS